MRLLTPLNRTFEKEVVENRRNAENRRTIINSESVARTAPPDALEHKCWIIPEGWRMKRMGNWYL